MTSFADAIAECSFDYTCTCRLQATDVFIRQPCNIRQSVLPGDPVSLGILPRFKRHVQQEGKGGVRLNVVVCTPTPSRKTYCTRIGTRSYSIVRDRRSIYDSCSCDTNSQTSTHNNTKPGGRCTKLLNEN